ncbi:MAG: malto-oligosyltrehalose trehalohydrolase [Candidatus Tectimicrobiota bacterium]|nr:MAG: malto-oligosyltrehalose trehalohydrolase [Candidatus Tectomicrobia bacterium]
MSWEASLGATYLGDGRCRFLVWAPRAERVAVHLLAPRERLVPMAPRPHGYHTALVEDVAPGSLYRYRLDDRLERPDPASRAQPEGVHGPSQVVDPAFAWEDAAWPGLPLEAYVFYELHVGTFTPEGTFDAIIPHLPRLKDLGITALELMPVAPFPGSRNWGYDGVYPFAVHHAYGGPPGLKRLVNACHRQGLAVVLDVVYNHLGPEGNYLGDFGPYFTERYRTPWGAALNFDGPHSAEVRRYFIDNALFWITEYHVDALRLDALHAILDLSAHHFLEALASAVHRQAAALHRRVYLIAESDLNDTRLLRPPALGGYGLDAQWNDDFHHALHALLTGERHGYYQDFGTLSHLAKAFRLGYVYDGQYSTYRQRHHGNSSRAVPAHRLVVFAQNHDQVGNRMRGERLSQLVSFEGLKLAAGTVLLSPFLPLLFMGEEYGETAPFPYFISHSDPDLVAAVREGRRQEFAAFRWQGEPPDPQDEATFASAKLNHALRQQGHHRVLEDFYRELLRLRTSLPALASLDKEAQEVVRHERARALSVRRWHDGDEVLLLLCFGSAPASLTVPLPAGQWHKRLDSATARWQGPGSPLPEVLHSDGEVTLTPAPQSVVLWQRQTEP